MDGGYLIAALLFSPFGLLCLRALNLVLSEFTGHTPSSSRKGTCV